MPGIVLGAEDAAVSQQRALPSQTTNKHTKKQSEKSYRKVKSELGRTV
jgi:hypothetical protein